MRKTADARVGANRNLRLANEGAEDGTIKRRSREKSTMAAEFAALSDDTALNMKDGSMTDSILTSREAQ